MTTERARLVGLEKRWTDEKALVDRILEARKKLRAGGRPVDAAAQGQAKPPPAGAAAVAPAANPGEEAELAPEERQKLLADLHELQESSPSSKARRRSSCPSVDEQAVSSVVADWTGIPVGRMVKNEIASVLSLAETLESADHRPAPCARDDRQAHPDFASEARQPE